MGDKLKGFLTLKDVNVKNKVVLLRVDLNSSVIGGKVLDSQRFKEHAETVKVLKRKGARVIILSHQGRPGGKDFTSLKQHAKILNKYVKVKFVEDVVGEKAIKAMFSLKPGEALLLDNVRKLKEEFKPGVNTKLVKILSKIADIYVQDAFSIVHRKQSSIVSFPKVLSSYVGPVLMKELTSLNKIKSPKKPIVYVLGGVKTKDYAPIIKKAKKQGAILILPNKKQKDLLPAEIEKYSEIIKKAKTVFMKGSLGYIEDKKFQKGTLEVLKAIASNKKAFKVIGGGSLVTLIKSARINTKKFSYISLSGGALLKYLAGEKLPGLEVLKS